MIPKETFEWIVIIAGWLIIPIISSQYFVSRRRTREQQLRELFGRPRVVERYLACKRPPPPKIPDEREASRVARLHEELKKYFDEQFKSEYGLQCYVIPSVLATLLTGLVITLLVSQGFGGLIENLNLPQCNLCAFRSTFLDRVDCY